MWNLTCHLHMLILAAPRDPSTFKKSLEEWKGQAHPHSGMSSRLSHGSGMNTDMYTDRAFHTQELLRIGTWLLAARQSPTLEWNFTTSTCSSGWRGSLPLTDQLSGWGEVMRAGWEHTRPPSITWRLRGCCRNLALWSAHRYHSHQPKQPHPQVLVPEQLCGLLVWSSQPSREDGLPNLRKLGVEVNLMLSQ